MGGSDEIPRTRVVRQSTGALVEETLFLQNDETRRIFYDINLRPCDSDPGLRGALRNFIGTIMVDTLSNCQTLMTFRAEFDVGEGVDVEMTRALIEAGYSEGILKGVRRYFAGRS